MTLRAQLDDALRRVRDLEQEVRILKTLSRMRIDVPPHWIIQAAKQALGRTGKWNDSYDVARARYMKDAEIAKRLKLFKRHHYPKEIGGDAEFSWAQCEKELDSIIKLLSTKPRRKNR